jgi:phage terminase Nu1 subunit (DNA packaging protein)
VVVVEARQKTRLWLWQAQQEHWHTFRHRQSEEEHGTWVEGVKERVAAKAREMVVSLVQHPS